MASEKTIDASVIKKTQDTLGKLINKPALTEKLLRKPPFRFLHDIVKAIIKDTGYFNGLYTKTELDFPNIKDREAKMAFLQKLIDVLKLATNENVSARPSKIVAGHEADKTNELLQLIANVIINKVDCQKAIKDVVSPKIKSKSNISSNKSEEKIPNKGSVEKSTKRKDSDTGEKVKVKGTERDKVKVKDTEKEKVKVKDNGTEKKKSKISKGPSKENQKKEKLSSKTKKSVATESVDQPESLLSQPSLTDVNESEEIAVVKSSEEEIQKGKTGELQPPVHNEKKRESLVNADNSETLKNQNSLESEKMTTIRRKSSPNVASQVVGVSQVQIKGELTPKKNSSPVSSGSIKTDRSKANRTFSEEATTVANDSEGTDVKRQSTFVRANSNEASNRPRTSLRPPSVRPASARPGAPRRRDKNVEIILQPNEPVKMAGINVKVEAINSELEDDGENLVIIESTTDKAFEAPSKAENDAAEQQGHLVQQILETQKELVQTDEMNSEPEMSSSILLKRQSSATQMDSIRDVIQNLTRSINPLGKLMDFIPEDFDSMQLELAMWRDVYFQSANELKKERSHTESAIEPLKAQLAQVNAAIAEHVDLIGISRAKILQNYDKIFKLLTE